MRNFALRTAVLYFLAGTSWIISSDLILNYFIDQSNKPYIGAVKGIVFVLITAIVLYLILNRYIRALRRNETQYRILFRSHPQALWVYDVNTLKFLAVNNATIEKYGYTAEEFMNMTMLDIRPKEERDTIRRFLTKVEKAEYISDMVHLHMAKDGRKFYTRTSSHATEFEGKQARMVMAVDAEAEMAAERRSQLIETRLNSLMDNSEEIIWIFDEDRNFILYNRAFRKKFKEVLGFDVPPMEKFKLQDLPSDPILQRWANNFDRSFRGERLHLQEAFTNLSTGQEEVFEIDLTPIYDHSNKMIGVGCFARDITERIRHEEAMQEQVGKLKEIAWMQSHTVRRPVANIMGLVELIKMNTSDKQQIDEAVQMLERSCQELDEIIREVVRKAGEVK